MSVEERLKLLSTSAFCGVASIALLASMPAYAQDADEPDEIEEIAEEEDEGEEDRIVITGSRLGRTTFNSASPVQIIDGQVARESGLFDVQEILSSTPQVTGQQIDQTFNGFVLDNGVGSQQVNFRGLGAGRTLILINGKRMAPAGVGGAPTSPDVSLIPRVLIDRVENLLDGASSIYGSDAVAGVSNIILKSEFDGLRLEGSAFIPEESGGERTNIAASWGVEGTNGFVGFGVEYTKQADLSYGDRDFLFCNENIEQGESGAIRRNDISRNAGVSVSPCKFSFNNRIDVRDVYRLLYATQDGSTNVGIPGFNESTLNPGFNVFNPIIDPVTGIVDGNGDGLQDVDFFGDFNFWPASPRAQETDFLSENELLSFYTYGEYDLNRYGNMTAYFEASYNERKTFVERDPQFLAPLYPGDSPFNPCNNATVLDSNGVDTGVPQNPNGVDCFTFFNLGPNLFEPGTVQVAPQVRINGVADFNEVEIAQTRLVGGLRGELPFLTNIIGQDDWTYDTYISFSRSSGQSNTTAIINDRLLLSIETAQRLEDGSVVCGVDFDGDGLPDVGQNPAEQESEACVPVNLFAPEKYGLNGGTLTPAEYDYLVGNRLFNTVFEQTVFVAFASGTGFNLPWNDNPFTVGGGFEYREDRIRSDPSWVSSSGQQFNFFTDPGASGARDLYEVFGEFSVDILSDVPFAEVLTIEGSARWTEESTYGSAWTYSAKGFYKPFDWLTVRGTYGTSFRAPNAREQFLQTTTGFLSTTDPCVVPVAARLAGANPGDDPTYQQTDPVSGELLDTRINDPRTIDQCIADGVDPFSLGLAGDQSTVRSIEVSQGGTQELDAETSRSFTAGVVVEPLAALETIFDTSVFDRAGVILSATYYDILIEDSIQELGLGAVVNECYTLVQGGSTCDRLTRDADGFLAEADVSPVNIGEITSVGIDVNGLFSYEAEMFGETIDFSLDLAGTLLLEQNVEQLGSTFENAGQVNSPDWVARGNLLVDWENWRLNWFTRFIQGGKEPATAFGALETCTPGNNPDVPQINELCRPVFFTRDYFVHNASIAYAGDTWVVNFGVRNVFDRDPELVDSQGAFSVRNVPIGAGYDFLGRTFFLTLGKDF